MSETASPPPSTEAEWRRIDALLSVVELTRAGEAVPDTVQKAVRDSADEVRAARTAGAWAGLVRILEPALYNALTQLDVDLLSIALASEAVPILAPRVLALQPHLATSDPGLSLIQELLLLDSMDEVNMMLSRLAPAAPLQAGRLIQIEGEGASQTLRASAHVGPAVLGRSIALGPPPGSYLVPRRVRWSDLVLPQRTLNALQEIVAWIRNRDTVFGTWGARRLSGPLVLFSGPSGVGKSYSAAAIATELSQATGEQWSLYALDLGRILSKYVGETEKNLNRLLDAMHGRRAILQIDEADGLLGKRGDVSDARDRYSNIEVSHMLSRFETHDGPVILTTNLRANIDSAFLRRFQLIIDFPSPERAERARLWSMLLPPHAPRDADMVPEALADAVALGGGAIHNAAIFAAMLAADEGAALSYRHISRAVWRELNKDSRQVRLAEIGFLADHLPQVTT